MVYEDELGQLIPFDTRTMAEPPHVLVPAAERWADKMPMWAHAQRDLILARLRGAGCVVAEQGGDLTSTLSPDGSLRVDEERQYDERSGLWETVQVRAMPGGRVLGYALNYGATDAPRFPRPSAVVIPLMHRSGLRQQVEIDAAARTFRLDDADPEPLHLLQKRLEPDAPAEPYVSPAVSSTMSMLLQALMVLGCALFVLAGAWVAVSSHTSKDRWMGVLCIVFFGACGVASWAEWRQARRGRLPKTRRRN